MTFERIMMVCIAVFIFADFLISLCKINSLNKTTDYIKSYITVMKELQKIDEEYDERQCGTILRIAEQSDLQNQIFQNISEQYTIMLKNHHEILRVMDPAVKYLKKMVTDEKEGA